MGYSVELYSLISNPLSFAIRSLPDSCNGNSPDIWIKHTNSYYVMTTSPSCVRFLPTSHIECLGIPDENLFRGYKHPSDQAARKSNEIISVVVNAITAIVRLLQSSSPFSHIPPRLVTFFFQSLNYLHHLLIPVRANAYP